jgi:hypothetical protein
VKGMILPPYSYFGLPVLDETRCCFLCERETAK